MQRKVIQLAGKTAVISLPSKWVKRNSIRKGDELEVEEDNRKLIVSTRKDLETEKKNVDANEGYDSLTIAYLYQAGVDEIRINYQEVNIYEKIKEKLPDLMGYEIVDQGERYIEIKNVSEVLEDQFDTLLRRIFHIIEDLGKTALEAAEKKDYKRLEALMPIENSIDKLTDFCKRVLTKKSYKDDKSQFYYVIVRDLEKIGDLYEDIIKVTIQDKIEINIDNLELFKMTNDFFTTFHKLFYNFNEQNSYDFRELKEKLREKGKNALKQKKDIIITHNLVILSKTIADLYGPLYITKI